MEKTRQKSENVPPWEHNPSAWSQRWPVAALAVVAGAIACYMGAYQWGFMATVWDPVFGDGTANVLSSDVSKRMHHWFGIPDAIFGAFAYLGDAVFAMAGSTRRWKCRPWMVLIFGIDVIPLGSCQHHTCHIARHRCRIMVFPMSNISDDLIDPHSVGLR